MIRELDRSEAGIPITADLFRAVGSMNAAAHGIEIPEAEARESERIGLAFLKLLRRELG